MATRKIIGIIFSIIAVLSSVIFITQSDLSIDINEYFDFSLKSYFSLAYFNLIMPLIICLILLYGGILLILKPSKSNAVLALFGFTVLEEIIFSWFNIITIDYPTYIVSVFFCCAVLAIWIAYSNTINLKRLYFKEGVSGLMFGTLINVLAYYI